MGMISHNSGEVAQCKITLRNNGVSLHAAQLGRAHSAPTVLLLHGFPECWYSWRNQMSSLHNAGFHVIAIDLRGYGRSDCPESVEEYTTLHIVGDLIGLMDALSLKDVFVVGHDWGSIIGWDLCLFRPDRVKAYVAVSVPFRPRHPEGSLLQICRDEYGDGFYMAKFQKPETPEQEFARLGISETLKRFITDTTSLPIREPEEKKLTDSLKKTETQPRWFTEEDLKYYTAQFELSGFTGPLNYYRAIDRSWELKAAWTNVKVQTPALFIAGNKDLVLGFPGTPEYIKDGGFKAMVPNLKDVVILEGGHYIHQESPEKFNAAVIKFFKEQPS